MSIKYVGMDIHQSNTTLEVIDENQQTLRQTIVRTERQPLRNVVESIATEGDRVEVAFEESQLAEWAYQTLKNCADRVVVCDPTALAERGSKSDKIDANKLARYLRMNELNEVYHGAGIDRQLKELVSGYEQTNDSLIRAKNRLKAVFQNQNISVNGQAIFKNTDDWLEKLSDEVTRLRAEQLSERVQMLEAHKSRLSTTND